MSEPINNMMNKPMDTSINTPLSSPVSTPVLDLAMVAGETSGDMLAARLLSGLRKAVLADASFSLNAHGIGGPKMAEQGFRCDWSMEKLSVRGLFEVLRHYREIAGIRKQLRQQLLAQPPKVFVGVDAPDFNLDLEVQLKEAGIPTLHYISPSIWAWRGGRIHKIKKAVSHMLVVFPFEEKIYQDAGIPVTYVGHPLAQVIPLMPNKAQARNELGLEHDAKVVAVLPGSRLSEIKYNTKAFIETAEILLSQDAHVKIIVPMAGNQQREYFHQLLVQHKLDDVDILVIDGQSHLAIEAADAVLVASGTATLEVALYKRPMVIAYKMNRASWWILKHMGYQAWVGLPNIIAQDFIVPEYLQDAAQPEVMAQSLWNQIHDLALQEKLQARFTQMHHDLLRDSETLTAQAVRQVAGFS